MNVLEREALKYDLSSLINLQIKRKDNILLFEQSIQKERDASFQEEVVQTTLESKIKLHNSGIVKLDSTEYHWILSDLPKIKSTLTKRIQTIMLLKNAIIEEQNAMEHEQRMIVFLESNGNKK